MRWLRAWWPALVWAAVISSFSTSAFTSDNTSRVIVPFLHWLLPHADAETLSWIHYVIRKCGHATEYFVLSLLLLRGFRARHHEFSPRLAMGIILMVAAYAAIDEFHQSFVPGRTAAVADVLLDTAGGAAAQVVVGLGAIASGRWRRPRPENLKPREDTTAGRFD